MCKASQFTPVVQLAMPYHIIAKHYHLHLQTLSPSLAVGHGRSGGDRMHVTTFDTYVQDVIAHVKDVKAENEGVPVYLMGHSMVDNISHYHSIYLQ